MSVFGHCRDRVERVVAALLLCASVAVAAPAGAQEDGPEPLLMEGKEALYQRVLTRPGAMMVADPATEDAGTPLTPFSVFYVYDRKFFREIDWAKLGARDTGGPEGWVAVDQLIDWKQAITVAFTNRAGRERSLLFRDRESLLDIMESETVASEVAAHREIALSGDVPPDFPVISIEPAAPPDIQEEFYLLPILDAEEVYLATGFTARLLQIASVTREARAAPDTLDNPSVRDALIRELPQQAQSLADLKSGIVFVIDTTTSMQPYIEQTRDAVRRISEALIAEGLGDKLRFGLVGFRDNTEVVPELDYVTQVFAPLEEGSDHQGFFDRVGEVTAATVSSKGFIEDGFSGIVHAIEAIEWEGYGGRFVVLITDAGARGADDPLGGTGMGPEQLREMARLNDATIFSLHLLTEEGTANHAAAAAQYAALSTTEKGLELYYPVAAGDVDAFAESLDGLSEVIATLVGKSAKGEYVAPEDVPAQPGEDPLLTEFKQAALATGLALQLDYLGSREGAKAPTVFDAWAADRALENPDTATLSVHLLLTKNQLSDLQDRLRLLMDSVRISMASPQDFFAQVQSTAATMSRAPEQMGQAEATTLAETGILGEYLAGLPYQSKVLTITPDLWLDMSVGDQENLLAELGAKLKLYQKFHDDTDKWVVLDSGATPGERVYPVPLDALP